MISYMNIIAVVSSLLLREFLLNNVNSRLIHIHIDSNVFNTLNVFDPLYEWAINLIPELGFECWLNVNHSRLPVLSEKYHQLANEELQSNEKQRNVLPKKISQLSLLSCFIFLDSLPLSRSSLFRPLQSKSCRFVGFKWALMSDANHERQLIIHEIANFIIFNCWVSGCFHFSQ